MKILEPFRNSTLSRAIVLFATAFLFGACSTSTAEKDLAPDQIAAIKLAKTACYGSEEKFDAAFPKCIWKVWVREPDWELVCGYYWNKLSDARSKKASM